MILLEVDSYMVMQLVMGKTDGCEGRVQVQLYLKIILYVLKSNIGEIFINIGHIGKGSSRL